MNKIINSKEVESLNTIDPLLEVFPPLIGALISITDVPDRVFADKMVGDGIAIDPFDNRIYAPVTGVIKSVHKAKHAITITSNDIDILVHIGLETVGLNGEGFKIKVSSGDRVTVGDMIGEFDMDFVARGAKSLISPVLIVDNNNYSIKAIKAGVASLDSPILKLFVNTNNYLEENIRDGKLIKSSPIVIVHHNGIHARPAALISSKARDYTGKVLLEKNGVLASAKSIMDLLGLSINKNDTIFIYASSWEIIDEIISIINNLVDGESTVPDTFANNCDALLNIGKVDGSKYYGIVASDGICAAHIVKNNQVKFDIVENSTDSYLEQTRLFAAINTVKESMEEKLGVAKGNSNEASTILSAHLALLTDPNLLSKTLEFIQLHKTAEYALTMVINEECEVLAKTGNKLLIERQMDLRDIYNQILLAMDGVKAFKSNIDRPSILIADELVPSDIIALDKNIVGLVSVQGGRTSHVAVLARASGIPLLVGVNPDILKLKINDKVILNNTHGFINVDPDSDDLKEIEILQLQIKKQKEQTEEMAQLTAVTIDGISVNCLANIVSISDADKLSKSGADGIGLFRTEFMFLEKTSAPTCEEQMNIYAKIAGIVAPDQLFVIRTLDAGGDKEINYLNMPHEQNPALGIRGIRLCLEHKELFVEQLTAILKVCHNMELNTNSGISNIKIMLPMISNVEEYRQTRDIVEDLKIKLSINIRIELGIMVEVPSVALQSEIFAKEVDFFSIGTNDLSQYILAMDREHTVLTNKIDYLHPAVLRSIDLVVKGACKYGKPVSVCGLMASDKVAIPVLLGLGIRDLSMNINEIPQNKVLIRQLDSAKCREVALECLVMATSSEVRSYLEQATYTRIN